MILYSYDSYIIICKFKNKENVQQTYYLELLALTWKWFV